MRFVRHAGLGLAPVAGLTAWRPGGPTADERAEVEHAPQAAGNWSRKRASLDRWPT